MSASKKEEVLREISEIEADIAAVKAELNIVENEEKLQNHKKNVLEVKKDVLCRNIEFYRNKTKKLGHLLSNQQAKHSQFSTAEICYDKLLEVYTETYLGDKSTEKCKQAVEMDEVKSNVNCSNQAEASQTQFEELQLRLENNFKLTKELLEDLLYTSE